MLDHFTARVAISQDEKKKYTCTQFIFKLYFYNTYMHMGSGRKVKSFLLYLLIISPGYIFSQLWHKLQYNTIAN